MRALRCLALTLGSLAGSTTTALTQQAGQRCYAQGQPAKLPPVDAITDSVALVDALTRLNSNSFETRIAIHQASSGDVTTFVLGKEPGLDVQSAVDSTLRRAYRIDGPSVVLRANRTYEGVTVQLERSRFCEPLAAGGDAPIVVMSTGPPTASGGGTLALRIRIAPDGTVRDVVKQSGTVRPALESEIIQQIRVRRYLPALLDGRPVEVWLMRNRAEIVR